MTRYHLDEWAVVTVNELFPPELGGSPAMPSGNGQTDAKHFTLHPPAQPPEMAQWDGLYTLTAKTEKCGLSGPVNMAIAVALGIQDGELLGLEVEQGRVAFLTCENPDGLKLRVRIARRRFGIEPGALRGKLLIQSSFDTPERMLAAAHKHAKSGEFKLIILDTLQSFFPGDDSSSSGQVMKFLRALRPLTFVPGSPAVLIAAHPKKDADATDKETMIPYGSGAILNEVDGNLCLSKLGKPGKPAEDVQAGRESETIVLHWTGKLRMVDFEPKYFRIDLLTEPETKDAKGRLVQMPVALVAERPSPQEARTFDVTVKFRVLGALYRSTVMTQVVLASECVAGKSAISKNIALLKTGKLVEEDRPTGGWRITKKGKERWEEYLNEAATKPGGAQTAMRLY
jgi:AAA domain